MSSTKVILIPLLLLGMPVICDAQKYSGPDSDIQSILGQIEEFSRNVVTANFEGIANSYTEDARIMVSGRDIIQGRELIRQYWTPGGASKTVHHKIFPEEISVHDYTAYDYGRYEGSTLTADGNQVDWKGKYVIIWKKISDNWLIYVDIWNRTD